MLPGGSVPEELHLPSADPVLSETRSAVPELSAQLSAVVFLPR